VFIVNLNDLLMHIILFLFQKRFTRIYGRTSASPVSPVYTFYWNCYYSIMGGN